MIRAGSPLVFPVLAPALLALLFCAACGETANLGDDDVAGSDAPSAPLDPAASVAHGAMGGIEDWGVDLIVDTDFIYFSLWSWRGAELRRCRKEDCRGSARVLVSDASADRFRGLRTGDGTLNYALSSRPNSGAFEETQFFGCAAPDCREPRGSDVFPGMLQTVHVSPQFAHWTNSEDNALYRCPLPDCEKGPEVAIPGVSSRDLAVNETHAFAVGLDGLWRVPLAGGVPEALKVVDRLEPSTRKAGEYDESPAMIPVALALDGPWLYLFGPSEDWAGEPKLLRVPSAGHEATEHVVSLRAEVGRFPVKLAVFDGEIVWGRYHDTPNGHELWSCRVEDCDGTSRQLTAVAESDPRFVAASDSERLYWFEGRASSEPGIWSAPRLPRP
jgi:hypothetical protein